MFQAHHAVRAITLFAGLTLIAFGAVAQSSFWTPIEGGRADAPTVEVSGFDSWQLDVEELEHWLARVPVGKAYEARSSAWVLELPMPDGHTESFTVVNSPIMAPELAARFPEIQVYAG